MAFLLAISLTFSSCNFRYSVLFSTNREVNPQTFALKANNISRNYKISANDYLAISVFTNKGERLIDPNGEFRANINQQTMAQGGGNNNNNLMRQGGQDVRLPIFRNSDIPFSYLVTAEGHVDLPMIGKLKVEGLTLQEASDLLTKEYGKYYLDPFIMVQYLNKRVLVMGALGEQVVPLRNENMTLLEVLTIVGGMQMQANVTNIRLIRPDPVSGFKNPSVQIVNLGSIKGLQSANLDMMPNDVVYIEPRRKFDTTNLGIITGLTGTITSLVSVFLLFKSI